MLGSLIISGDHFPKAQEHGWVGERPAPLFHAFWLQLCRPLSPTHLVPSLLRPLVTGRLASAVHVCVCVRARVCVRVWWSHRRRGDVGRWEAGEGVLGNWGGARSLFLSLSAGFGGFSLPVSVSFALPLSRWFTEFCIVNSRPLRRRLVGGKVGMGLTERRAVPAAGVST